MFSAGYLIGSVAVLTLVLNVYIGKVEYLHVPKVHVCATPCRYTAYCTSSATELK